MKEEETDRLTWIDTGRRLPLARPIHSKRSQPPLAFLVCGCCHVGDPFKGPGDTTHQLPMAAAGKSLIDKIPLDGQV